MAWPAVKQAFTQAQFAKYVEMLTWPTWRPSLVVWHNTAAPSLAQWEATEKQDVAAGRIPGVTRIANLEMYFRDQNGWSGAPHLFIAQDYIWVFNRLDRPGVHSPSWNSISWGFEMVGDFDTENADAGDGLKVKNNCIFATAVLCEAIGLQPHAAIRLHKEDPKTTHDCPGKTMALDRNTMIDAVAALMTGGEHTDAPLPPSAPTNVISAPPPAATAIGVTTANGLNVRRGPGVSNESIGSLPKDTSLAILDKAQNGITQWLKVRTPEGHIGWVSGLYVKL